MHRCEPSNVTVTAKQSDAGKRVVAVVASAFVLTMLTDVALPWHHPRHLYSFVDVNCVRQHFGLHLGNEFVEFAWWCLILSSLWTICAIARNDIGQRAMALALLFATAALTVSLSIPTNEKRVIALVDRYHDGERDLVLQETLRDPKWAATSTADVGAEGRFSLLLSAARAQDKELLQILIDNGADLTLTSVCGWTALHLASGAYHPLDGVDGDAGVTRLLINGGADVDAADLKGRTPLIWAMNNGSPSQVVELLLSGADPLHKGANGESAYDIAIRFRSVIERRQPEGTSPSERDARAIEAASAVIESVEGPMSDPNDAPTDRK